MECTEVMRETDAAVAPTAAVARPLKVLVPLIQEELDNAYQAGIEHYRQVGELLQEAKYQIKKANESWAVWLMNNFELSQRTAEVYMKLAGDLEFQEAIAELTDNNADNNSQRAANPYPKGRKTLSDFTQPKRDRSHRPDWYRPIMDATKRFDTAKIMRDYGDKLKENTVKRELALQLIDLGFRVLAKQLHPDKGGSTAAMVGLSEIRKSLKTFAENTWKGE